MNVMNMCCDKCELETLKAYLESVTTRQSSSLHWLIIGIMSHAREFEAINAEPPYVLDVIPAHYIRTGVIPNEFVHGDVDINALIIYLNLCAKIIYYTN